MAYVRRPLKSNATEQRPMHYFEYHRADCQSFRKQQSKRKSTMTRLQSFCVAKQKHDIRFFSTHLKFFESEFHRPALFQSLFSFDIQISSSIIYKPFFRNSSGFLGFRSPSSRFAIILCRLAQISDVFFVAVIQARSVFGFVRNVTSIFVISILLTWDGFFSYMSLIFGEKKCQWKNKKFRKYLKI